MSQIHLRRGPDIRAIPPVNHFAQRRSTASREEFIFDVIEAALVGDNLTMTRATHAFQQCPHGTLVTLTSKSVDGSGKGET